MTPLQSIRERRGQTRKQVAEAVGTNAVHYFNVETGKRSTSLHLAEKLSKHFGGEITEIQILYPQRFVAQEAEAKA